MFDECAKSLKDITRNSDSHSKQLVKQCKFKKEHHTEAFELILYIRQK